MYKQGFSLLELLLVMGLVAIISAVAVPKFAQMHQVAKIESSAMKLLSFLKLAAFESQKRQLTLYVYYIPSTEFHDACIALSERDDIDSDLCSTDNEYGTFSIREPQFFKLKTLSALEPSKLFYFSAMTGAPSQDLSLILGAKNKEGLESGVMIRRYKGLVGCSQTGVLNWQSCS